MGWTGGQSENIIYPVINPNITQVIYVLLKEKKKYSSVSYKTLSWFFYSIRVYFNQESVMNHSTGLYNSGLAH